EQHAPARPHERETSPQEGVAWRRNDTVHHVKRGKALRERLPLPSLVSQVSQASLQSHTSDERQDHCQRAGSLAVVTEVNLFSPLCKAWGAAKRGRGKERNTPAIPAHSLGVLCDPWQWR